MNKEEYEMRMYEEQMKDEYRNRKQRLDAKNLFKKLRPQLEEMKYESFEDAEMLEKIYKLEEIITIGEKINKFFDKLDD